MKKLIAYILIFLMCLGVCSCTTEEQTDGATTTPPATTTTTNQKGDGLIIDYGSQQQFGTLEGYQAFLDTHELPTNFITYSQLSWLGVYYRFYYCSPSVMYYAPYEYRILDIETGTDYRIGCYYDAPPKEYEVCIEYTPEALPQDLTRIYVESRGDEYFYFYRMDYNEKITYLYSAGQGSKYAELDRVLFEVDDVLFSLSLGSSWFANCESQLIQKLINSDTVEEAYNEFAAHIRGTTAE